MADGDVYIVFLSLMTRGEMTSHAVFLGSCPPHMVSQLSWNFQISWMHDCGPNSDYLELIRNHLSLWDDSELNLFWNFSESHLSVMEQGG